jgi:2-C-methyl-D-erythritol 4-phosphate cytidylyltransferase
MLLRALRPFTSHPDVSQVVAVLPRVFAEHPPEWLAKVMGERLILARGGASRTESVRSGVNSLRDDCRFILVHDAARPFPSRTTIDAVMARARSGVGAVAAVPLSDTVKEVAGEARVTRTVPRSGLWRAQTPQGFPRTMLLEAFNRLKMADSPPTDDAEVCERAGFPVDVVPDTPHNFKVTTPDDFRIADALARELR